MDENVCFLNHRDVLRCFGYKGGHYQRAIWRVPGTTKEVWFPKLYENYPWDNSISPDGMTITMKNKSEDLDAPEPVEWIVFAHNKNFLGQVIYKYLGEFSLDVSMSSHKQWVLNRTKEKTAL